MTHNGRIFFSLHCVGLSQELALCVFQHERAISQLQVASENSLLCAFQFHTRCLSFFFFFFSSKCCHCIFKTAQVVSVSQTGSQRHRIQKRQMQMQKYPFCLFTQFQKWQGCFFKKRVNRVHLLKSDKVTLRQVNGSSPLYPLFPLPPSSLL